jgi:hypothetical protein
MGTPVKIPLDGKPVFLCCSSCEDKAKADPQKTLATVEGLKAKKAAPPPAPSPQKPDAGQETEVRDNLAKLSREDRELAEAQRWCPVQDDNRLGSMGVPLKVLLKDSAGKEQPVFLCCKGCVKDAQKDPAATLAQVKQLKAKAEAQKAK